MPGRPGREVLSCVQPGDSPRARPALEESSGGGRTLLFLCRRHHHPGRHNRPQDSTTRAIVTPTMSNPSNNPFAAAMQHQPLPPPSSQPEHQDQHVYQAPSGAAPGYSMDDQVTNTTSVPAPAAPQNGIDAHHTPHNPFLSSAASGKQRQMSEHRSWDAEPEHDLTTTALPSLGGHSTSTNPFQAPTKMGYEDTFLHPAHLQQPAQNQHDSIADDLAGLNFGISGAPAHESAPAHENAGLGAPQPAEEDQRVHQSEAQPSEQISAAPLTTYAPPPGPPPPERVEPFHASESPSMVPENRQPFDQMAADEDYARKLWAAEEERQNRHRSQRTGGRSGRLHQPAPSAQYNQHAYGAETAAVASKENEPAPPRPVDPNEEKQWNTKEVYWQGRSQRIIVQNENGPCSLIALCNVLLLRGTVQITPPERPAVSYSYLSSLLGEHLIDAISASADSAMDLEAALSILPQTQTGLDVNVRFAAIDAFAVDDDTSRQNEGDLVDFGAGSSSKPVNDSQKKTADTEREKQRGELALFKLCNVPLVHGWLADKSDLDTWEAVVERTGDYDKALDRVVAGDELAKGQIVEGSGTLLESSSTSASRALAAMEHLSPAERVVVNDAFLIRRFLETTATQLTYPGLHALSTTLERGALYALFRNSHLSVVYRPQEEELLNAAAGGNAEGQLLDQPQLYQLVTDATLENEDGIVWESLEDVDGSASRFFDGKFRPALVQGDFAGRQPGEDHPQQANEDADMAYAQRLQWQEQQRADRYRQRQQRPSHGRQSQTGTGNDRTSASSGNGGGNVISRMLAARKQGKQSGGKSGRHLDNNIANTLGGVPYRERPTYPQPSNGLSEATESGAIRATTGTDGTGGGVPPGEEITQPSGSGKGRWWKRIL